LIRPKSNITILILGIFFMSLNSYAQDKESWFKNNVSFTGYIKYLNTSSFRNLDSIANDNLLHNRLNFEASINNNLTATIEIRNRVFWGSTVQHTPNYSSFIDSHDGIDLSADIIDRPALLVHSKIDRLFLDYYSGKWQITLGRQRINWGKNLVWNPNDLFNAYNFFDFDYEEKPGTDALRMHYFITDNSSVETAINYTDNWKDNVFALKYNLNVLQYDFQAILAKYLQDVMLGLGWEGAIKTMGFKGELSYFMPEHTSAGMDNVFVGSISFDYYFRNGTTLNLSGLYNGNGIAKKEAFDVTQFGYTSSNVKQLMPNQWSFFAQVSKTITPAINASLSSIYAFELRGLFFMPQFSYNIAQNWDFDTTAQIFYGNDATNQFSGLSNAIFLRMRWSF